MNPHQNVLRISLTVVMAVVLATVGARESAAAETARPAGGGKKLLVFILAGQSNMQGHAEVSTLAYLPKPAYVPTKEEWIQMTSGLPREIRLRSEASLREQLLKDPVNARLPKKEFGALLQQAMITEVEKLRDERFEEFKNRQTDPARVARDKELAAIFTPGLTDENVLATAASAKTMNGAVEVANAWQTKLHLPVGKHTWIAAYGGVNRGGEPGLATGPLGTGYGARPTAFGPEYAFGILMEKHLDQPVLIIKTAWGGKSLHYDFRPPSAGPYQPTAKEKEQLERWKVQMAAWEKYLAGGGTPEAMARIDKEFKDIENEQRVMQAALAKLPDAQRAAGQEKLAALNAKSKELGGLRIPHPGDMPTRDAAGVYWHEMIGFVRKVLADPKTYHPDYDPKTGFEVAGAVWFQGFNDQFDPEYHGNYSKNMVHFIQDLRKEVKQPAMPFVIGVLGTPAFREEAMANTVASAQREAARAPELAGTVAAVESWPLTTPEVAIWRMKMDAARATGNPVEIKRAENAWPLYGSNLGYHYDGSGRFFIRLGDAFATAMGKLMGRK